MAAKGYVEVAVEVCKGCGLCVTVCPVKCLDIKMDDTNSYGLHYAYQTTDTCIACTNCAVMCPDAAITVYRKNKEA